MNTTVTLIASINGRGNFAYVGLHTIDKMEELIVWNESIAKYSKYYAHIVMEGVKYAISIHKNRGGTFDKSFCIDYFEEFITDMTDVSLMCASCAAAWLAMGNNKNDLFTDSFVKLGTKVFWEKIKIFTDDTLPIFS